MLAGSLLANDEGGYALAMNLCADTRIGAYAGAVAVG